MRKRNDKWKSMLVLAVVLAWMCAVVAMAGEGSNDNSLADLGILTEGAEVFPELEYGVTEYEVRVPAGTQALELDPVPTNGNAWIVDITGTELVDGEATVEITVEAQNGERFPYYLHVTEVGGTAAAPETEPVETEPETEPEPETEDPRYVKVDRTTLQEAENTINALKDETRSYRDRSVMLMRLLYGMIAFSVVLLFIVINLLLKKKDMKAELEEYRGYGYSPRKGYPEDRGYSDGYAAEDRGYSQGYAAEDDGYAQGYGMDDRQMQGQEDDARSGGRRSRKRKQRKSQAIEAEMQGRQESYADERQQGRRADSRQQESYNMDERQQESYMDEQQSRRADSRQQESYMDERQSRRADSRQQESYNIDERQQEDYVGERRKKAEPQLQVYMPEPPETRDDPATVPKPEKAKKKAKKMPEYQQPQQQDYSRRQPRQDKPGEVEITMIDL